MSNEQVTVTQADRDAAEALLYGSRNISLDECYQAFARHRLSTQPPSSDIEAERDRLREALIECGRAAGAFLADNVSTEFLMLVPAEVHARIGQLADACAPDDGPALKETPNVG
jgi:hypothetical protein